LFVAANNIIGPRQLSFSVVRYGNVMGSRGSVIPFFLAKAKEGVLPITDEQMTRFSISIQQSVAAVLWTLEHAQGGEIIVPKIPSYRVVDLAEAIGPSCRQTITGIRPGEKIHEDLITTNDSLTTVDLGDYYCILPNGSSIDSHAFYEQSRAVAPDFAYNSGINPDFLSVETLRTLIRDHIDPAFVPV
jgi:FlaA1/EpsC-like NDP-sugar epimerase